MRDLPRLIAQMSLSWANTWTLLSPSAYLARDNVPVPDIRDVPDKSGRSCPAFLPGPTFSRPGHVPDKNSCWRTSPACVHFKGNPLLSVNRARHGGDVPKCGTSRPTGTSRAFGTTIPDVPDNFAQEFQGLKAPSQDSAEKYHFVIRD